MTEPLRPRPPAALHAPLRRLVRTYIRFSPVPWGRWWLWWNIVDRYFTWEAHPFTARTRFGARMRGDTRDVIEQYLYWFGFWEPHITAFVGRRLSAGNVFVDVGANVGYYTLLASNLVGETGSVVAVEASPTIVESLRTNIGLNGCRNVPVCNVDATAEEHPVQVHLVSEWHRWLTSLTPTEGSSPEAIVPGLPLAEVLEAREIEHLRLVKIDVEGSEGDVVAGITPLLERAPSSFEVLVEVGPKRLEEQGRSAEAIFSLFNAYGFHPYAVANPYKVWDYLRYRRPDAPTRLDDLPKTETDVASRGSMRRHSMSDTAVLTETF